MNEFDSFFGSVWRGEAPADALVDWILERVDDYDWMPANPMEHPYAYYSYDAAEWSNVSLFMHVHRSVGDPSKLIVTINEVFTRHRQSKAFTTETFSAEMDGWLKINIDRIRYSIDMRLKTIEQEMAWLKS